MKNRKALLAVVFALAASLAFAQSKPNFSGSWKVNIQKSTFEPFPAPQSQTTKIDHQDPSLKVTTTSVGDQGERTMEFSYKTDGSESTNSFGNIDVKSKARWDGSALLIESKANFNGDEITIKDKWTLSDDGKTITMDRSFSGPQGEAQQKVVSEKQ